MRIIHRRKKRTAVSRRMTRPLDVDETRLHRMFENEKSDELKFLDQTLEQGTPSAPVSTPATPVVSVPGNQSPAEPAGEFVHETKEQPKAPTETTVPDDERIFLPKEEKKAAPVGDNTDYGRTKNLAGQTAATSAKRSWTDFFAMDVSSLFRRTPRETVTAPVGTVTPGPQSAAPASPAAPTEAAKDTSLDDLLSTVDQEHERELQRREQELAASGHAATVVSPKKEMHVMEEAPVEGEKGEKDHKGEKPEKKSDELVLDAPKAEEKKPDAPATPAPAAAPAKPTPKPRKKLGGSLADFLGAIKYIGLGKEKNNIVQNLATMLNAGLPLIDSLKALQMESRYKPIKKLLGGIITSVESGFPLWRSMENEHFFSPHAIALVRIGEEAGNLAENMEYLAAQQEKDQALKSKVTMAMIYPSIVMVLMFVVVMVLGIFVLPNLIGVLTSLNVELPLVTRIVIAFTNFMSANGTIIVPASIGGIVLLIILAKFTPLRGVAQWIMFHIPGIGSLARQATIARFGVIMGGLMQAGVPLVEALRSLVDVTPIVAYKKFYAQMLERILLGDSFAKGFTQIKNSQKILPISVQQLVMTGEKAGSLSKILMKIADIYEKKANDTAQRLPVILEPMILLFIGALVATIAMAIIVPIYSIVGNVGH